MGLSEAGIPARRPGRRDDVDRVIDRHQPAMAALTVDLVDPHLAAVRTGDAETDDWPTCPHRGRSAMA